MEFGLLWAYWIRTRVFLNWGVISKEFTLFNREGILTIDAYHTFFENQLVVDLDESAREVDFYALDGKSFFLTPFKQN